MRHVLHRNKIILGIFVEDFTTSFVLCMCSFGKSKNKFSKQIQELSIMVIFVHDEEVEMCRTSYTSLRQSICSRGSVVSEKIKICNVCGRASGQRTDGRRQVMVIFILA
jgi:Na+-transporting NADH:ubiquinone oxidoreductase subunit NqrE